MHTWYTNKYIYYRPINGLNLKFWLNVDLICGIVYQNVQSLMWGSFFKETFIELL